MNNIIEQLKLENLLFVDIETVRGQQDISLDDEQDERLINLLSWMYRDKEKDTEIPFENVRDEYLRKGALTAEIGKIVCITVGKFDVDGNPVLKSFYGDNEVKILSDFVNVVKGNPRILVGHNIIGFDLPYIRKRYFSNQLDNYLTFSQGNDSGVKPWDLEKSVVDTMNMWKGTGFTNTSLDMLCYTLGIPSPKTKLQGNEVSNAYYNGKVDEIASYCEQDVLAVMNVILRLQGKEIHSDYITANSKEKVVPKGLIEVIKDDGKLTKETEKELLQKVKELTIEEKQKTIEIVNAALAYSKSKLTETQIKKILK